LVFSNFFIVAQLLEAINAPTIEAMHASKEILMNELGVSFRNPNKKTAAQDVAARDQDGAVEFEGTVDGSVFRFSAAHFEWLLRMTSHLGLRFKDVGKRRHGTRSTLFFCDELARIYGSEDTSIGLGASFALENWAAAGFWKELIHGLQIFKKREVPGLPLGFFTWHDMVEDQHAQHTWDELEQEFFAHEDVNEEKFIRGAVEMLDGVLAFWNGLNADGLTRTSVRKVAS
jgi:pyrroloquinoline quinone (PQQ) biosynthesis protein C